MFYEMAMTFLNIFSKMVTIRTFSKLDFFLFTNLKLLFQSRNYFKCYYSQQLLQLALSPCLYKRENFNKKWKILIGCLVSNFIITEDHSMSVRLHLICNKKQRSCRKWLSVNVLKKIYLPKILQNSENAEISVLEFLSNNFAGLQAVNFTKKGLQHMCLRQLLQNFQEQLVDRTSLVNCLIYV